MPPKTDKLEKNAPSNNELNPLSNPLLATHLGRWAEVYFTNRPEHRDQAVLDLVRELEIEAEAKGTVPDNNDVVLPSQSVAEGPASSNMAEHGASANRILCDSCGYINSDTHSYCGMCGVPLTSAALPDKPGSAPCPEKPQEADNRSDFRSGDLTEEWQNRADHAEDEGAFSNAAPHVDENDLPHFARQPEAVSYRHRLYVGLVLLMLLGGLIYVSKRGSVFFDGQSSPDSKIVPAAQPAPDTEGSQNQGGSAPLPVEPEGKENPPQAILKANSQPEVRSQPTPPTNQPKPAPKAEPAVAPRAAAPAGQSGAEDLAKAQRYLSGRQGNAREAIPLLWDAVARGNASAMVALSDLYLRGDGVAQSCDQARVLLDSAAKKGAAGAGERLVHMQAFGCR